MSLRPVDLLVRLEWAALLVVAIAAYARQDASWWLFAALILAPDVSMLGYLAGPRVGAIIYNFVHTLIVPVVLIVLGWALGWGWSVPIGTIWLAHIAMDRVFGYGLKLPNSFSDTHMGRIGRGAGQSATASPG